MSNEIVEQQIKEFLTKMATQDRRCTASPYFYIIRTKKWRVVDPTYDSPDKVQLFHKDHSDDGQLFDTAEEFRTYLREYDDDLSQEQVDEKCEELREFYQGSYWEEHGMFLTEEDAENHLKTNHYHYSSDAHTYVKHAWRAPDLARFVNNLNVYFGVKNEN